MKCNRERPSGFDQAFDKRHVQRIILAQRADHDAVGPQLSGQANIVEHDLGLDLRIGEVAGPRPDEDMQPQRRVAPDGGDHAAAGGQPPRRQIGTQLNAIRAAARRRHGRGDAIDANLQHMRHGASRVGCGKRRAGRRSPNAATARLLAPVRYGTIGGLLQSTPCGSVSRSNWEHAMPAFPDVAPIRFEGPGSKNPLAFRHYDPDALVEGRSMREHFRFSMAYWHTFRGTGSDPFGPGTMHRPWEAAPCI
jgi:hypothetical protein